MKLVRWAKAELVKRETTNGAGRINSNVPLGKIYTVDMDSMKRVRLLHESGILWDADIINIIEDGKSTGWIFCELLKIDELEA